WRDDPNKCDICGLHRDFGDHDLDIADAAKYHPFVPSINEVALMHDRLQGLVVVKDKKDCLDLPDKRYRIERVKPSSSVLRVAKAIVAAAPNGMQAQTLLRELSDGFQYREVRDGEVRCSHCPEASGEVDEWFNEERSFSNIELIAPEVAAKLEKRKVPCPVCDGTGMMPHYTRVTKEVTCPKEKLLKEDLA